MKGVEILLALTFMTVGILWGKSQTPDSRKDENHIRSVRTSAIAGDPEAQYAYAQYLYNTSLWNETDLFDESLDWFKSSAQKGNPKAAAVLAIHSVGNRDFDGAQNYLKSIGNEGNEIVDNYNNLYITVNGVRKVIDYLNRNRDVSITEYGPFGNDHPFIVESNDTIYICASYKGKAGLIKLDLNGVRIAHDDIPLAYEYIVPLYGEFMPISSAVENLHSYIHYIVSPYSYKIPLKEGEIRALDVDGSETYFSTWGSEAERVNVIKDGCVFIFDSEKGSFISKESGN